MEDSDGAEAAGGRAAGRRGAAPEASRRGALAGGAGRRGARGRRLPSADAEELAGGRGRGARAGGAVAEELAPEAQVARARARGRPGRRRGRGRGRAGRRRGDRGRGGRVREDGDEPAEERPITERDLHRTGLETRLRARRPLAVAITGGIGAGKTEALQAFARHGAPTLSSDEIVHGLLREDDEVQARAPRALGRARARRGRARRPGARRRDRLRDRGELDWLESLLHPRVVREYLRLARGAGAPPEPPPVCVVEVPLLYETGESAASTPSSRDRAREVRAGGPAGRLEGREVRLVPDDEKVRRADFAYVNTGSLEELDASGRGRPARAGQRT